MTNSAPLKGKPLDADTVYRINHCWHALGMRNKSQIGRRLGIGYNAVGKYLMSAEDWEEKKKRES